MNEEKKKKTEWDKMSNFQMHVLTPKGENEWVFHIPNNSYLKMYFAVFPTMERIIILGDLGDWVFARNNAKNFLLTADNKDYFWEKVSSRDNEYSEEKTRKGILDWIKENIEDLKEEMEDWEYKDAMEKYKNPAQLDLESPEAAYNEIHNTYNFDAAHEFLVYTYPARFDYVYRGIEAFRKAYWKLEEEKKKKNTEEKKNEC